ncbi:hypothetical protein [Lachnobacterium bovis]|uniref:hypothetical protein n=1 Tax=Lachnobacterium bovis TaxID=140626 RepID=UPI00135660FB|nr:hypothetical protein [Lachnobacterium bovis]
MFVPPPKVRPKNLTIGGRYSLSSFFNISYIFVVATACLTGCAGSKNAENGKNV